MTQGQDISTQAPESESEPKYSEVTLRFLWRMNSKTQ